MNRPVCLEKTPISGPPARYLAIWDTFTRPNEAETF